MLIYHVCEWLVSHVILYFVFTFDRETTFAYVKTIKCNPGANISID